MNFGCPNCSNVTSISKLTISLFMSLFRKVNENGRSIMFLCDNCGNKILSNYRDTHGIGV